MKITRLRLDEELNFANRLLWDDKYYSNKMDFESIKEELEETQLEMIYRKNWGYSLLNYDGSKALLEKSTAKEMFLFLKGMTHILLIKSSDLNKEC